MTLAVRVRHAGTRYHADDEPALWSLVQRICTSKEGHSSHENETSQYAESNSTSVRHRISHFAETRTTNNGCAPRVS